MAAAPKGPEQGGAHSSLSANVLGDGARPGGGGKGGLCLLSSVVRVILLHVSVNVRREDECNST